MVWVGLWLCLILWCLSGVISWRGFEILSWKLDDFRGKGVVVWLGVLILSLVNVRIRKMKKIGIPIIWICQNRNLCLMSLLLLPGLNEVNFMFYVCLGIWSHWIYIKVIRLLINILTQTYAHAIFIWKYQPLFFRWIKYPLKFVFCPWRFSEKIYASLVKLLSVMSVSVKPTKSAFESDSRKRF